LKEREQPADKHDGEAVLDPDFDPDSADEEFAKWRWPDRDE